MSFQQTDCELWRVESTKINQVFHLRNRHDAQAHFEDQAEVLSAEPSNQKRSFKQGPLEQLTPRVFGQKE